MYCDQMSKSVESVAAKFLQYMEFAAHLGDTIGKTINKLHFHYARKLGKTNAVDCSDSK